MYMMYVCVCVVCVKKGVEVVHVICVRICVCVVCEVIRIGQIWRKQCVGVTLAY